MYTRRYELLKSDEDEGWTEARRSSTGPDLFLFVATWILANRIKDLPSRVDLVLSEWK